MLAQVKAQAIHERIRKIFKVSVAESNTRVGGAILILGAYKKFNCTYKPFVTV